MVIPVMTGIISGFGCFNRNWLKLQVLWPGKDRKTGTFLYGLQRSESAGRFIQFHIISCDFGDNVVIDNVNYLSHYIIGSEVIITNVNELVTTNHAKFGNGIIKQVRRKMYVSG